MSVAELLEREAIADGEQLLSWAEARAAELIAALDAEDPLRSLLGPGGEVGSEAEAELDAVPVTRRRRREPSSPQPKSADELPPPPEHPRLAEGEPEPMLETVDTGPIDLEEEIVRRRMREDSWAIAAREVEGMIQERAAEAEAAIAQELAAADEPSIEIEIDMEGSADEEAQADSDEAELEPSAEVELPIESESESELAVAEPAIQVEALADEAHDRSEVAEPTLTLEPTLELEPAPSEPEAPLEPATRAISTDSPIERPAEPSSPELPVVVGPAEPIDDPAELPEPTIDIAPLEAASEGEDAEGEDAEGEGDEGDASESASDEDDEFEVDELDELEVDELVEIDEEPEDDEPSSHKPPPPPPKSAPPPIRNEVADLIAELSAVQTGDTAVTKIDDVEGAPPPAEAPASDDIDIDVD